MKEDELAHIEARHRDGCSSSEDMQKVLVELRVRAEERAEERGRVAALRAERRKWMDYSERAEKEIMAIAADRDAWKTRAEASSRVVLHASSCRCEDCRLAGRWQD